MRTGVGGVPWAHHAAPWPGGSRRRNGREPGSQDHVGEEDRGEGVTAGEPGTHVSRAPGDQGQGFREQGGNQRAWFSARSVGGRTWR